MNDEIFPQSPNAKSASNKINSNRDKSSKSLTDYTLSEPDHGKLCRAGYFHLLREMTKRLVRRGLQCNVYLYVHAQADYKPVQSEFNWENGNSPLWILKTNYREIAREISGERDIHPQTIKRALQALHRDGFLLHRCDGRKVTIGIQYNWDFIKSKVLGCDNLQKAVVTVKQDPERTERTEERGLFNNDNVTGCDGQMRKGVTPWFSNQVGEIIKQVMPQGAPSVTENSGKCDGKGRKEERHEYISKISKLVDTYLGSLDAAGKKSELHAMLKTMEKGKDGASPWSRAEALTVFKLVYADGVNRPARVWATIESNRAWLLATARAFYKSVPIGKEQEACNAWLEQFQRVYPDDAARARAIEDLRETHRGVLRLYSDLTCMRWLTMWLWAIDRDGEPPAAPTGRA